jgi:ferritin-like metal-binding protein YciE
MDASPDLLADAIRAKRADIDNDLEQLRGKLADVDPRRRFDARRLASRALPVVAGTAGLWLWARRRRRVGTLEQLLVHGLTDLYRLEQQLIPELDRMGAQAWNEDLANAFAQHRIETEGHVDRLERAFRSVSARPKRGSSAALDAIVSDAARLLGRRVDRSLRDAWLIATAQRIEHLEIANYGTARTYANMLGFTHAADLLQQTLEEERAADEKLTHLAERFVNVQSLRASRPA